MLVIREAVFTDVEGIASLHAKSWQQNYKGALSDVFLDTKVVSDRIDVWTKRLQNPDATQYSIVAELDSAIIGFACAYLNESPKFGTLLDNLHVSSESQGLGIGAKLMASVAEESTRWQPNIGIYLWVLRQNSKAMGFYENLGGTQLETVEEYELGDRDHTVMKCRYVWHTAELVLKSVEEKYKNE